MKQYTNAIELGTELRSLGMEMINYQRSSNRPLIQWKIVHLKSTVPPLTNLVGHSIDCRA